MLRQVASTQDPLMTTAKQISEHLVGVINNTPLDSFPFDHVALTNAYPNEIYEMMLNLLPVNRYYRELKHSDAMMADGQSARLQFPLNRANIARLPNVQREYWNQVLTGLDSKEVAEAWRNKFKPTIETVTGRLISAIKFRPHYTLFRDLKGYKISIHPDSPRKAITIQYYLPADESQIHLGTLFHEKNPDGNYREARAMLFAPNTGYAFAVTPASYHSVKPMSVQDTPRNSLMVIINYDRGPLLEGFRAVRIRLRAWYDQMTGLTANR
ncbi:hypothetical protein [Methyloglobulus sp.]|uniref:hypothetical protein n=1 Tax=Methyloglobulus sp. TaxID=2518622 RepID=UPI003988CB24